MSKKDKSYYEYDRNLPHDKNREEFIKKMQAIEYGTEYKEPRSNCCEARMEAETLRCSDCKENATPEYYIGSEGLEAIDVVHQFNLSYDLGSACSYILRAKNKHDDEGYECITKAIRHLQYELRKIKKKSQH